MKQGTRAQQALQLARAELKTEQATLSRQLREQEEESRFQFLQEQKKAKHCRH